VTEGVPEVEQCPLALLYEDGFLHAIAAFFAIAAEAVWSARSLTPERLLEHMRADKKVLGGRLRLVLLRGIGEAFVTADYPAPALDSTLAAHTGVTA